METTTKTEMYAKCMMEVTPQMAAEWLATNPNNRSVNRNDVRRYAKKMQENDWIPNNDFISIESNGTLINGQHRLNAVILANRPVKLNVLFNAVRTPYYDTGRNRSLRDQIIMGGLAQAGTYATNRNVIGTARLCLRDIGESTFKKADAYEILDWCHRHLEESKLIVDLGKIKNPEALAAIQLLTNKYKAEKEQRIISDSLNDTLKEYSLNVSEDTLRKVLDTSGVKIDKDGKVVGAKEAIEALKTSEPGFFKDKEKESNPLNEGFNPVEKKNTGNINSFSQAFKLMDEVNN